MMLRVSNTSEPFNDDGEWQWKVMVDADDIGDMTIHKVTMQLHPTFSPSRVILSRKADNQFESGVYAGWGTFEIPVEIVLSHGTTESTIVKVVHTLVFEPGKVHTTEYPLKEDAAIAQAFVQSTADERNQAASTNRQKRSVYLTQLARVSDTPSPCFRLFWHGRLTNQKTLAQPTVKWLSRHKPRDDHSDDGQPGWLTATEYQDVDSVLETKLQLLADLMRASQNTVVYSGAGISVAAGIGQAARGGKRQSAEVDVTAQPTLTHRALTALHQHGLLHGWIQQNHDGLPQKAGFPQECINEIHGSWYDPSNPVVLYSGQLKTYEYEWMAETAETADLVLVLGTSMSGLSADQTAIMCAERSKRGKALGMVIVNLQQTLQDGKASLRLFEETDVVFQGLLQKLDIALPPPGQPTRVKQERVLVPYNRKGQRSKTTRMWWDLRPDAQVQLTEEHNLEGSQQPFYRYAAKERQPQGYVTDWNNQTSGIHMSIHGVSMTLGQWWLEAAQRGGPVRLPVVNVHPEFEQENAT